MKDKTSNMNKTTETCEMYRVLASQFQDGIQEAFQRQYLT